MLIPNQQNRRIQALTRAKAKMFEFNVPLDQHINTEGVVLSDMLDLTIGILGDLSANKVNDLEDNLSYLLFSAQYLNSIIEADCISQNQILLKLLSASAYFLSGYPGSSNVLIKNIEQEKINGLDQIEQILFAILKRIPYNKEISHDYLLEEINNLIEGWNMFLRNEATYEYLEQLTRILKSQVYKYGSDKDLLLVDVIRAMVLNRYESSLRFILSENSDIDIGLWQNYLSRPGAINEFWPSQIKLAKFGVLKGLSAIIQMPTSAGKTKATEFIIRSAFLSNRATLAIIVAPFRSLCQEIYNDFINNFKGDQDVIINLVSDVLQEDLEIERGLKSVLILTPEKLDFILRYNSALISEIGLIIYDEGHLFDDTARGIKYELLLSSLKQQLSKGTQVVLISAVIKNAMQVKEWLLDERSTLVDGKSLSPTSRNIAFVEWTRKYKNLQFVSENNINDPLFYVPTILRTYETKSRNGRRKSYPRSIKGEIDPSQVAGLLGTRLSESGLSAIFVGQKLSAQKISKELIDAFECNLPLKKPLEFTKNITQANKIISYIVKTLGPESINSNAAKIGILMHHAGIPHGLRLVTEDALQNDYFKLVVCTSTLAQGVNLPIRYLIISTSHQAGEKIKTRDFHNLMGRAGRSGKYTEGTIIFSNPKIYEARNNYSRWSNRYMWNEIENLLDRNNSEPSQSRLQNLISDQPASFASRRFDWDNDIFEIRKEIASFLLNALSVTDNIEDAERIITNIVENTLGFAQLQTFNERDALKKIFLEVGLNVLKEVPNSSHRLIYSRSIVSIQDSKSFVSSIQKDIEKLIELLQPGDSITILDMLWVYLYTYSKDGGAIKKFSQEDSLSLCKKWITGENFNSILEASVKLERGSKRKPDMLQTVELCEAGFGYNISTLLSSFYELTTIVFPEDFLPMLKQKCYEMQKRLKYGLRNELECIVYELGFSDRNLSMEIADIINESLSNSVSIIKSYIKNSSLVRDKIENEYPEYFLNRLNSL